MPRLRRLSGADVIAILGTCHAIFRQASRFIAEEKLRAHFYSD
jgi:hypothetical protein